jgi:hypothetical protein
MRAEEISGEGKLLVGDVGLFIATCYSRLRLTKPLVTDQSALTHHESILASHFIVYNEQVTAIVSTLYLVPYSNSLIYHPKSIAKKTRQKARA